MSVVNRFDRGGEYELRCQGCGAWLSSRDLACGLGQFCRDCCLEPDFLHDQPGLEEEDDDSSQQ